MLPTHASESGSPNDKQSYRPSTFLKTHVLMFFLKDRIPLFSAPSNSFLKNLLSFELHPYCQPRSLQRVQRCWGRSGPQGAHRALTLTEEEGAPRGLVTPAVLPRLPLPSSLQHMSALTALLYVPPNVFKAPNLALKQ